MPDSRQSRLLYLHASSGISSVAHHNPQIKVFVVYLLMLELFVDTIHFFKFLSVSCKPLAPAKNYHCYSYIAFSTSFPELFHPYKEGEVPSFKCLK